jgi:predicted transposase/invertase (TIGR01784 family)
MGRYLDPKYDLLFKQIFGEHKHLCTSLIDSMLSAEFYKDRKVETIEYVTDDFTPNAKDLDYLVIDVRCTDNFGKKFIVEIQVNWDDSFQKRILFNATRLYVRQFELERRYTLLYPVYILNFVNMAFEKDSDMLDKYYHHYRETNLKHPELTLDCLTFTFIELPKFKPDMCTRGKMHELWLRFLTEINESTEEISPELLSNSLISEAVHYTEMEIYDQSQLLAYNNAKKAIMNKLG